MFVGDDAGGDSTHHRIGAVGGQSTVVRQRHHLGNRQHHQLGPQAHESAQSHEHRIRPVSAHRRPTEMAQQAQQQRRVLLLLGHEKLCRAKIFRIAGPLRLA